jgi:hypothetical protein
VASVGAGSDMEELITVCIFDIHEFLRLRCLTYTNSCDYVVDIPGNVSVPLRERLAREQQSNPSPREAPLSGYINYDSEPSGCNNKLDGLSDRTDRRLSPLVLLIKSLDETARKHGLG